MVLATSAFFGLKLDLRGQETLCDDVCGWLKNRPQDGCFRHQCLNAVKLPQAQKHAELYHALQNADCLSPDGMGIVWAARLIGIPVGQRVTGIDLMTALLPRFAKSGVRVFLLGAKPDVVDTLWNTLPIQYPGLVIAGAHHGYELDDDKLAAVIRESGADALFVALPSPRKELFVDSIAAKTGCRFAMGVGGAFDVLAGEVHRAPVIWQKCGLEFLWRILCQPRRMMPRYVRGLAGFGIIIVPAVLGYHADRLRKWSGVMVMALTVMGMAMSGIVQNPTASAASLPGSTSQIPAALNQQDTRAWIEQRLSEIATTDDLDAMINDILGMLIGQDTDTQGATGKTLATPDWDAVDEAIKALLVVFEAVLKMSGANSFLIEAVVGGVIGHLFDIHPEPERFARMVDATSPGLSGRMFGNRNTILFDSEMVSRPRMAIQPGTEPVSRQTTAPDRFKFAQPSLYFIRPVNRGFAGEKSSWGTAESEENIFDFVSEDASPR